MNDYWRRVARAIVATLAVLAFLIAGFLMVGTRSVSGDSIFEPLINGLGWMSFGAAGVTIVVALGRPVGMNRSDAESPPEVDWSTVGTVAMVVVLILVIGAMTAMFSS